MEHLNFVKSHYHSQYREVDKYTEHFGQRPLIQFISFCNIKENEYMCTALTTGKLIVIYLPSNNNTILPFDFKKYQIIKDGWWLGVK